MTRSHLLAAVLALGACARPASQPRVVGPVIGESTAPGPSDPSRPPPDPGGVKEVSRPIHGTPTQVANPVITVDTMPSTLEPSGNNTSANQPTTVVSGVASGPAPVGTTPTTGTTGTAGPNGPGTGNGRATSTGPATGGATTTPGTTTPANPPAATAPSAPPSNGPGTGNTVNTQPVAPISTPTPAPVTPR
jgi:hypothetical protein